MKLQNLLIQAILLVFLYNCTRHYDSGKGDIIIKGTNIISMTKNDIDFNQSVLIRNGKIQKIGDFEDFIIGDSTLVLVGENQYLMPGLVDMHVHLADSTSVVEQLKMNIAAGVTQIRVMFSPYLYPNFKKELNLPIDIISPKIQFGYLDFENTEFTKQELDTLLPYLKNNNYDFIKIFQLKDEISFENLMKAAKKFGMGVCGHYPSYIDSKKSKVIDFKTLLESGYKSIEHLGGYSAIENKEKLKELIRLTKVNNVYNCPTLDFFNTDLGLKYPNEYINKLSYSQTPNSIKKKWDEALKEREKDTSRISLALVKKKYGHEYKRKIEVLKMLYDSNCLLLLGGDAGGLYQPEGLNVYDEMKHWQEAGIDIFTILKSATITPAKYFGEENRLGSVEVGKDGTLIMLSKNPLDNIDNITTIHTTIINNKVFLKADLLKSIDPFKTQKKHS